jgi:hypothetical protein
MTSFSKKNNQSGYWFSTFGGTKKQGFFLPKIEYNQKNWVHKRCTFKFNFLRQRLMGFFHLSI